MRPTLAANRVVTLSVALAVFVAVLSLTSCGHGKRSSKPAEGCRGEQEFCTGRVVQPLSRDAVIAAQTEANEYATANGARGIPVFPRIVWHPCFFTVSDGQCAAGWTKSMYEIHVSTAQPERTAALVKHETLHARYCEMGDCDTGHRRPYGW